jgi:sugar lactone lactonase YvrE
VSVVSRIACIADARDRCGEGAVWHEDECAVYWTDINRFLIHRLEIVSGALSEWHFGEPVVAISLTSDPRTLLVALGSRLLLWRPRTDTRFDHGFAVEGWPRVRFNDGRADPCGNFWIGSMRNNVNADGSTGTCSGTDGKLFKVSPNGDATVWRQDIGISNTLCWSPDRKTFYFGDSLANVIYSYDFDAERGEIANERPYFTGFERGIPDGSAVDCEGFLWNCRYGGGCIVRIAPDGSVDTVIEMPTQNPTTCTFGGKDLRKLYVTSAETLSPLSEGPGGSLFEIATEVNGLPERKYILR